MHLRGGISLLPALLYSCLWLTSKGCPMDRLSDRGSARVRIRSSWVHDPCLWPVQAKLSPA